MLGDAGLSFREFAMREPLPLATVQASVLEFLRGRTDAVLFGAQAVNAYVEPPRMTQDVDILSNRAQELAEELQRHLGTLFQIAVRVRSVGPGTGYRLYQVRKPKNRHLVDLRQANPLPEHQLVEGIPVAAPVELISQKVIALASRRQTAKGGTDVADLRRLLLAMPALKTPEGPVADRLRASGAPPSALAQWRELAAEQIMPENDEAE